METDYIDTVSEQRNCSYVLRVFLYECDEAVQLVRFIHWVYPLSTTKINHPLSLSPKNAPCDSPRQPGAHGILADEQQTSS